MLHTDFVSNFRLFFEHAFRLDTRRQKIRLQPATASGLRAGIRANPGF